MKYKYITFDGVDGVGKTTMLNKLADYYNKQNLRVYKTKAVGGDGSCDFQYSIRNILLHKKFPKTTSEFEQKLFCMADIAGNKMTEKELINGNIALKDRGIVSHMVFPFAKDIDFKLEYNNDILASERELLKYGSVNLVYLPSDINVSLQRIKDRNVGVVDRLENVELQTKVLELMLSIDKHPSLKDFNIKLIMVDADDSIDDVFKKTLEALNA